LAAELEKELGAEVSLVKGKDGVFEVEADGRLVFSKRKLGRFPEPGEVIGLLR
jgi:selenoprotein W-related protein